jgi:hypothetical protein
MVETWTYYELVTVRNDQLIPLGRRSETREEAEQRLHSYQRHGGSDADTAFIVAVCATRCGATEDPAPRVRYGSLQLV